MVVHVHVKDEVHEVRGVVFFTLVITNESGRTWSVPKRYTDFVLFDAQLREEGRFSLVKLPPKFNFALRHVFAPSQLLQDRRVALQHYLSHLVAQVQVIGQDPTLQAFLDLDWSAASLDEEGPGYYDEATGELRRGGGRRRSRSGSRGRSESFVGGDSQPPGGEMQVELETFSSWCFEGSSGGSGDHHPSLSLEPRSSEGASADSGWRGGGGPDGSGGSGGSSSEGLSRSSLSPVGPGGGEDEPSGVSRRLAGWVCAEPGPR